MNDGPQVYSPALSQLAWFDIPAFPKKEASFLDVADVAYHENTISHIYVWFLNHSNKAVSQVFRDTLLELIGQKGITDFEFEGDFWAEREYYTTKGNRIDIVMQTTGANSQTNISSADSAAIVIENKIFHFLSNDLQDYLNAVSAKYKAGVLLTLRKEAIPEHVKEHFVNITHAEWCSAIQQKGIPHSLTPKEFIYLTDFLSHMTDIANSQQSEEARFFFDHSEKILRAVEVRDRAWDYVIQHLQQTAKSLSLVLWGNSYNERHFWSSKIGRPVYYVIELDKILTSSPTVRIKIEVYENALNKIDEIEAMMKNHDYFKLDKIDDSRKYNKCIAGKTYSINRDNWISLNQFIYDIIETDFKDIWELILNIVEEK
ncbi:MAG: PD-(D/E)XK nuclease family protein [Bacteroidetes bacterium]|nr:PD-(D/E)XK nuclease family protein [Bacteroidota bacterium]